MKFKFAALAASAALSLGLGSAASAAMIEIAGNSYDEAKTADSITVWSGQVGYYNIGGGATSASEAIGGGADDGVYCVNGACSFLVNFDGGVENQDGFDLAFYGLGTGGPELFDLAYNGVRIRDKHLTGTGSFLGKYELSVLFFDLSDFGVALGETINSFKIIVNAGSNSEEFASIVSLNADVEFARARGQVLVNPIPAAAWLFGTALFAGGFATRKRKQS